MTPIDNKTAIFKQISIVLISLQDTLREVCIGHNEVQMADEFNDTSHLLEIVAYCKYH